MTERISRDELRALASELVERGMTIERLAEATRIHPTAVADIMSGRLLPEPHIRKRLADALGLDSRGIE